jgi:hypothetical protein
MSIWKAHFITECVYMCVCVCVCKNTRDGKSSIVTVLRTGRKWEMENLYKSLREEEALCHIHFCPTRLNIQLFYYYNFSTLNLTFSLCLSLLLIKIFIHIHTYTSTQCLYKVCVCRETMGDKNYCWNEGGYYKTNSYIYKIRSSIEIYRNWN